MPSERQFIEEIGSHVSRLVQAVADAQFWHDQWLEQAGQEHKRSLDVIERRYQQGIEKAQRDYNAALSEADVLGQIQDVTKSAGLLAAPWDDSRWASWAPPREGAIPPFTRIGQLIELGYADRLTFPALLPIIGGENVLFKASGEGKQVARAALESIMLRMLITLPPGKLRFVCIDPVGLGSTVAGFIKGLPDSQTGGRAWFESRDIEQQLANLEAHMAMVRQKYLGVSFTSMEEYNAHAGQVEEPYRLLLVADFPARFTDSAAQRLVSIATNGPGTGVYVLAMVDTNSSKMPYGFDLADLERTASVFSWKGDSFVWEDPDFQHCSLELDRTPPATEFERFVGAVGEGAILASEVQVPFDSLAPPRTDWWRGDTRAGVRVPIGQFGARETQCFTLDQEMLPSAVCIGRPGSGKSTLLHVLIHSLALTYSPEELELYLLDLKEVEFKDYATHQLPHARVVAINCEREFGLSVLQGLDDELRRRMGQFRENGSTLLSEYRDKTKETLPRVLLMVDEFQELFSADDTVASQAGLILDRLLRMGRAFGINVFLASQTLAGQYALPSATKNLIPIRIALQCSETDSRLVLSDDNDHARLLERPGEAIYNTANGRVEGNTRFQVLWLATHQREEYLREISALALEKGYRRSKPQIVFEGNAPAEVDRNLSLHDLLAAPAYPGPGTKAAAWLGEPIAIKGPTAANFRRQSASHLLIVGQNAEAALGMMVTALISLAAQTMPATASLTEEEKGAVGGARFYVLDLGAVDSPHAGLFAHLAEQVPLSVRLGRPRELPAIIGELSAEVQRRIDADGVAAAPMYLFLCGLHRARDLRQEDTYALLPRGGETAPPTVSQQFTTLLREGSDFGVHAIVWCDTAVNLNRALERRAQRDFGMRVVLQMSAQDSASLIDTPAGSVLGPHRAILYNEDEGLLEKFRPYAPPSEQWLAWVGEQLRSKVPARDT